MDYLNAQQSSKIAVIALYVSLLSFLAALALGVIQVL
jgi:hypothetical protein